MRWAYARAMLEVAVRGAIPVRCDAVPSERWISSCHCDARLLGRIMIGFANAWPLNCTIIDLPPLLQADWLHQPPAKAHPSRPVRLVSPQELS